MRPGVFRNLLLCHVCERGSEAAVTLRTFRILASFAALLLTLWIGLSILVGLEVGSAYLMMIQSLGDELSVLTASWALPLLGVSATSADLSPRIEPWVAIIPRFLPAGPSRPISSGRAAW